MSRSKLYFFVLVLSMVSGAWLFWNQHRNLLYDNSISICLIKTVSGYPCPSCGTTRSVMQILNGNFREALIQNPLGYIAVLMLLVFPFWILVDLILKSDSFLRFYKASEKMIRRKPLTILLLILILLNWIWNLYKNV